MANLQQASTSGTQTDSAHVYDTDGSAEVYENCDDNEIFNMFTREEQYTELLEPISESHQVPQNDNDVISEDTNVEQAIEVEKVNSVNRKLKQTNADLTIELVRYKNQERCFEISQEKYNKLERCYQQSVYQEQCLSKKINSLHLSTGKQIMTLNEQIFELNKQLSMEKSTVSFLLEEKKRLKSDFKTCKDKLFDKQIQLEKRIKELNNIVLKTGQSIQTIHMLSPKPDSFYHTEQKMALGYQNPFYLKQAQKKKQSLYDGKVLLEKHDPPVVHNYEETLQLAQESRDKMKPMNKEIKPANYTKINHLSGVFVPQTALSREELYFSNNSKTANISKSISKPNEDLSDDTTPSVARKFLNEEAAKFVGDFKSLTNEADASLAKHKALELEIKRLLKAVVSQDIMIIVQNEYVDDTSDLQTELEHTKERFENCIIKKETEYAKLWNDCMGDEHLNTIPATESDEFIKSCIESLVPNPSESEGENKCDMPTGFTTFSNVLFDDDYDSDSSDDQSQDIYASGSENHLPMLNKDNYVPWSSRIIRYVRSRPNGKIIVDSIENRPYVRRMIATLGELDLSVPVPESFHEQTMRN
uniref:Uncharacterized protein n=1 Tax=Tanacetum cinerariifolium TaxID=118510 RepID=A0A699HKW9_TANCI|nr:hypothetical protein [Tanacetum cinerariifolium]